MSSDNPITPPYKFGPFTVNFIDRLLLRDGVMVPLPPKVFELLLVLIENPGRLISKDELTQRLWPDCFVEESSMAQLVFQLRRALGESASKQQYIETIPKRGYRFMAAADQHDSLLLVTQHNGTRIMIEEEEEEAMAAAPDPGLAVNGHHHQIAAPEAANHAGQWRSPEPPVRVPPLAVKASGRKLILVAAAVLIVAVGGAGLYQLIKHGQLASRLATSFQKMRLLKLTTSGKAKQAALSPDGKYVAYVLEEAGQPSLWVRQVASTSSVQIVPPAEVSYLGLTFSRDSNFLYYVSQGPELRSGALHQVSALGGTPRKILAEVDSPIAFSPDGKRLAFVRNYPLSRETALLVANLDGSQEQKIAARKRPHFYSLKGPSWSPDGKMIACAAGKSGHPDAFMQVVTVQVADGQETPIGTQTWAAVGQVGWLGDGSAIVASAWHQESPVYADQLWHLSYPGGEVRRITNDLISHDGVSLAAASDALVTSRSDRISRLWIAPQGDPSRAIQIKAGMGDNYSEIFGLAWTPSGSLVYGTHASGNADIWMMDADGSHQRQLTFGAQREIRPVVSADGEHIVFVSQDKGHSHLWRMKSDGSGLKQLTKGNGGDFPTLSPDGRWVVYTVVSGDWLTLWKVSMDGGEPAQITTYPSGRGVISPDGKLIACYYLDQQKKRTFVAVIPFEGGLPLKIFDEMPLPAWGLMRWTPDGQAITYINTRRGVSNLWLQPLDGGQPRQLTDFKEDQIFRFAWSHDGKNLAYERGMTINDVILISDFR